MPELPPERPPESPRVAAAEVGLVIGVVTMWLFASAGFRGLDPDFFWHVKTGQLLLAGLHPDTADLYSWTAAGRYWLDHEWLGEKVWAALLQFLGLSSILWLHWLALAAMLGLIIALFRRLGAGWGASGLASLYTLALMEPWYLPRLQLVSGFGLAFTVWLLQTWYRNHLTWLHIAGYCVLLLLWANLHGGGAIIGPASVAIVWAVEWLARKFQRTPSAAGLPSLRRLAGLAAAGWLTLLGSPGGIGLTLYALATVFDPRIRAMNAIVNEWHPFDFKYPLADVFFAWCLGLAVALWLARRLPRPGWTVLGLVWLALGFSAYRNMPLAAIGIVPLWAFALAQRRAQAGPALGVLSLALLVCLVLFHPYFGADRFGQMGMPMPSSSALSALRASVPGHKLLNHYNWGGEIIFTCYPTVKVFIDGRQYVYGLQVNRDYAAMAFAGPDYADLLDKYAIDRVFFPSSWPLTIALKRNAHWHVVYEDRSATLLAR